MDKDGSMTIDFMVCANIQKERIQDPFQDSHNDQCKLTPDDVVFTNTHSVSAA